ncbi:MAG: vitamin K epoxide reductase family protein, partial [Luteolibacter sp.]
MMRFIRRLRCGSWGAGVNRVFLILVLAGCVLHLFLFLQQVRFAGLDAGGMGPCGQVTASRWAIVFGVPVTGVGLVVYLGLVASMTKWGRRFTIPLLGAVLGSAGWFLLVQGVLMGAFCPWCLAAHGLAVAVVGVGALRSSGNLISWSTAAFLAIGLMQVYGPLPPAEPSAANPAVPAGPSIQASGVGRKISFDGGRKSFGVESLPRLGPADAKQVLVMYFDYQCPSCRTMGGYLSALVEKHPADICVLMLPVPLDPVCNESFLPGDVGHPDSCEFARIALAVWREKPEAFPEFHRAVLSGPVPVLPDVLSLARQHVSRARLDAAMK